MGFMDKWGTIKYILIFVIYMMFQIFGGLDWANNFLKWVVIYELIAIGSSINKNKGR